MIRMKTYLRSWCKGSSGCYDGSKNGELHGQWKDFDVHKTLQCVAAGVAEGRSAEREPEDEKRRVYPHIDFGIRRLYQVVRRRQLKPEDRERGTKWILTF